ncbi:MAG: hypothetical protein WC781_03410 [Candidatus Pacearchaeota archaeon]
MGNEKEENYQKMIGIIEEQIAICDQIIIRYQNEVENGGTR